jgi:hypothetical protein
MSIGDGLFWLGMFYCLALTITRGMDWVLFRAGNAHEERLKKVERMLDSHGIYE